MAMVPNAVEKLPKITTA